MSNERCYNAPVLHVVPWLRLSAGHWRGVRLGP